MGKGQKYDDMIFELGDLAWQRLASRPNPPRAFDRVTRADEALAQRKQELEDLEARLNNEDVDFEDFLARQEAERGELMKVVKQWKKAVDSIEGRTKALRKSLSSKRAAQRFDKENLRLAEARHKDLELTAQHDPSKLALSASNLKKLRVAQLRVHREIEDLEAEFNQVLTPKPGQPGAQGILAHKRILELEDEAEDRRHEHDRLMAELEEAAAAKEQEAHAAEDYLDQALYLLGEECYQLRLAEPALSVYYPRLDKLA